MIDYEQLKAEGAAELESYFSTDPNETWQRIESIFILQPVVYLSRDGRIWFYPHPLDFVETFVERFPHECEKYFAEAIYHANAYVAAYALIGLEIAESPLLESLPSSVISRTESLETIFGCLGRETTVGKFALMKQEEALEIKANKNRID